MYCNCRAHTKGKRIYTTATEAYDAKERMNDKDRRNGVDYFNAYYWCWNCSGWCIGRMPYYMPADTRRYTRLTERPEFYGL